MDSESPRQSATGSWQEQQRGGQLAGLGASPGALNSGWREGPVD